jgi:MoaA/NifB/PqqE/SkfB family radical SAM enzyme
LNSSTPEFHDWFCGVCGQFEIVKDNIKCGVDQDLDITVSMVITSYNIDQMYFVAKLAKDLGASSFKTGTILSVGRATDDLIYIDDQDIIRRTNNIADKFEEGFIFKQPEHVHDNDVDRVNCGVGCSQITVSPAGDLKFCEIQVAGVNFGNILNENPDVLFNNLSCSGYHNFQEPVKDLCGECEFFNDCRYCVVKGLQHYLEIGNKCNWGSHPETQKYIKTIM